MQTRRQRRSAGRLVCGVIWLIAFGLLAPLPTWADEGQISTTVKYAWTENTGWLNFRPSEGGVIIFTDHLAGYAWAENIGWVQLGSHTGSEVYPYLNTTPENWGVNHDGTGHLSGYAWSETAGWINFNAPGSQVTLDPATGQFDGYAWAENVGWVHFHSPADMYVVATAGADDVNIAKTQTLMVDRGNDPATGNPFVLPGDVITYTLTATNFFDSPVDLFISDGLSESVEYAAGTLAVYEAGHAVVGQVNLAAKYAWAENAGWLNARPLYSRVTVYTDHLTGHVWAENVGWIKLGVDGGGPYANTSPANWGVNRDSAGTLSGYAWSETTGWLNFNAPGQVFIDPATGQFEGYAWAENLGWVHFQNPAAGYLVKLDRPVMTASLLEYSSGLLNYGETLRITFDTIVKAASLAGALITNQAEMLAVGGLEIDVVSNSVAAQVTAIPTATPTIAIEITPGPPTPGNIPEPGTVTLMALGILGLLLLAANRRTRRQ